MSQGPLDRSRFEAIEAYVLGAMSMDERVRFEEELGHDATLRAELELQRENIRAVELGGMMRLLKTVGAEHATERTATGRGAWKRRLKYAAAIAIILSGSLWLLRPSANERLFAEHFVADPGLPVAMGATTDPAFDDAMVSYKQGHYSEARMKWATLQEHTPNNDTLSYYIGMAALAEGDALGAIAQLVPITNNDRSVFRTHARWYLFLAHVRNEDLRSAKSIDLSGDPRHAEEAKVILLELER